MKKPELLIPAGSLEALHVAVAFGADAVYIGGDEFGLRANAKNFSIDEIREGIVFAHAHDVRVYITVNIFAREEDLSDIHAYLEQLAPLHPDAFIVSDLGVYSMILDFFPGIDIHISTQTNLTNSAACLYWQRQRVARVVLARDLSLQEIKAIRGHIPGGLELEVFVHGAMCVSYSGRCLLSNYFVGRDANQGDCTHPCRWKYAVAEETRPGEYLPLYENERGSFLFSASDLCMLEYIPELLDCGIDSFKVEGRMKNSLYVAMVTRAYRMAIDDCLEDPERYRERVDWYLAQVCTGTYRKFSTGFFFGRPDESAQIYEGATYEKEATFLGVVDEVLSDHTLRIEQKNKFSVGETIEIVKPNGENIETQVQSIRNEDGEELSDAPHPKQVLFLDLGVEADPFDVLLRREEGSL